MNKLVISDNDILKQLDESIKTKENKKLSDVVSLSIKIQKSTDLQIECTSTSLKKIEIYINVSNKVNVNIHEIKKGKFKIQYKYYLEKESTLKVYKFNDVKDIKELSIVNLNGEKSKFYYTLKTISKTNEKYDLMIYHNARESESEINNIGVTLMDGTLNFNVSGFVPNNVKKCILNQNNRIINLSNNACCIKPNLFIDEEDVVANHSAFIGKFNDDELFYLMSRGISKKDAKNLLVKGLLLKNMNIYKNKIEEKINECWR